jgi:alpha-D-xyloside xylohydrolase
MTYTAESYASMYMPEKSLYQRDDRIFYQPGFAYDTVESLSDARFADGVLRATAHLRSGEEAVLLISSPAEGSLRLRFWQGEAAPAETSFMLVPQAAAGALLFAEDETSLVLHIEGYHIQIDKNPFGFKVFTGASQGTTCRMVMELETDKVAGQFVTGPMGFRKSPAKGSEAFVSWRIHNGEQHFGLGEKWNKVEKTSTRATIWACDTAGTNTTDMSYKSIPMIQSSAGWGMFLHSGFRSFWEIGTFSYTAGAALTEADSLDVFFFFAPTFKGLIGKYTDLTGKTAIPPKWALGLWMSRCAYQSRQQVCEVLSRLRAEGIPVDVVHLDPAWMKTHYYHKIGVDACDFDWNYEGWGQPEEAFAEIASHGVKICLWLNPYLPEGHPIYDEAKAKGYMLTTADGAVARLEFGEPVGVVDFTNPAAKEWWKDHLRQLARLGGSVFKPDYGDRVAEEAIFANGKSGKEMHSPFLHLYAEAAYEVAQEINGEGIVWRRAGYIGSQRYPGTWAGDTQITWEGMQGALRGGLSAGFGGEAFWSHDMGGFVGEKPSPELYIRWTQLGLFSPFSRYHGTQPREPWEYGETALNVARHYVNLRYSLIPYFLACASEAHTTGLPLLRHMHLEFQDDPATSHLDDQFMLGPDLLVAPLMQDGARHRMVYFPAGKWYALEGGATFTGPRFHEVDAPLERIPVFVRAGAVIPRYTHDPQNLQGPAPVALALDIYPGRAEKSITIAEKEYTLKITRSDNQLTLKPAPVKLVLRFLGQPVREIDCMASSVVDW